MISVLGDKHTKLEKWMPSNSILDNVASTWPFTQHTAIVLFMLLSINALTYRILWFFSIRIGCLLSYIVTALFTILLRVISVAAMVMPVTSIWLTMVCLSRRASFCNISHNLLVFSICAFTVTVNIYAVILVDENILSVFVHNMATVLCRWLTSKRSTTASTIRRQYDPPCNRCVTWTDF